MTENPDGQSATEGQPRPTPRPRATGRPSPRARIAGARRDRDGAAPAGPQPTARRTGTASAEKTAPVEAEETAPVEAHEVEAAPLADAPVPPESEESTPAPRDRRERGRRERARAAAVAEAAPAGSRRGIVAVVAALAVLCLLAAAGTALMVWQRLHPSSVDPTIFTAARSEVQALYAFDYKDANGSISRKLDVLTGSLRDEYKKDLSQGGIIDTYKQVSATTSYTVLDVGLQQVNDAQDAATVVVFGQYVVKSVNTASQKAPTGSECQATPDGGQSCTQTVTLDLVKVNGSWKIKNVTLITSS